MNRKLISSGSEFESKIGYSRAVVDGGFVFVSGTTGYDYDSMTISEDVAEQADQCLKNVEKALLEAGSGLNNIVRIRYIFPDKEDFKLCWPVFRRYLGSIRPAATMFVAGLLDEDMKLEIEVTAKVTNDA
jgi:enamine deaminase RidA (YjgF/YER057c/UK114 family)